MSHLLLSRSYRRHPLHPRFGSPLRRRLEGRRFFSSRWSDVPWSDVFSFSPRLFIFSAIIFVVIVSIISLVFSANEVTKGYVLRDLESKRRILIRENETKMMQVSQAQSLQAVLQSRRIVPMVPARTVIYMRGDSTLAKK